MIRDTRELVVACLEPLVRELVDSGIEPATLRSTGLTLNHTTTSPLIFAKIIDSLFYLFSIQNTNNWISSFIRIKFPQRYADKLRRFSSYSVTWQPAFCLQTMLPSLHIKRPMPTRTSMRIKPNILLNLYSHEQNIYKYTQNMQWKTNIKIIHAMFSEKGRGRTKNATNTRPWRVNCLVKFINLEIVHD